MQDQDVLLFLLEDDEQDALVHKTCFARVLKEYTNAVPCVEPAPVPPAPKVPPVPLAELELKAKAAAMSVLGENCPQATVDSIIAYLQSDRCSGQFWGAPNFSFIAAFHVFLKELTGATGGVMQHDTDAPRHGKGVSDGDGSDFKVDAGRAELSGIRMEEPPDLFKDMVPRRSVGCAYGVQAVDDAIPPPVQNDGSLPVHTVTRRKLHFVTKGTVEQRFKAVWKGAEGSRECLSARGCGDPTKVLLRRLSCPCWPCMRADLKKCETRELIRFYKNGKYNNDCIPKPIKQVSGAGVGRRRAEATKAAKNFVNAKSVGDFVAVNVEDGRDDEGHFYWLARITKVGYVAHLVISGREIGRPKVGIWLRCVHLARWLARKFAAQHAMTSVHQDKPRHSTDLVELRSPILWSAFMPFVATFMPLWNIFDHLIVAPAISEL